VVSGELLDGGRPIAGILWPGRRRGGRREVVVTPEEEGVTEEEVAVAKGLPR